MIVRLLYALNITLQFIVISLTSAIRDLSIIYTWRIYDINFSVIYTNFYVYKHYNVLRYYNLGDRGLEVRFDGVWPVLPVGVHSSLHSGHMRHNIPGTLAVRPTATHRLPAVQHTPPPEQPGTTARNRLLRAYLRCQLEYLTVIFFGLKSCYRLIIICT